MIIIPGTSLPALSNPGAAADLKNGKQLIDANGNVLTGTMPTITLPTPGITVSSGGLITASYEANAGYTSGGSKSGTKQLTTQASTTITPGTSQKTAVASGRYTTGTVYVAGDSDLKASNIKSGVNIFGVTGTLTGYDVVVRELDNISYYRTSGGNREYRVYYSSSIQSSPPSGGSWNMVSCMIMGYMEHGGIILTGGLANRAAANTTIISGGYETMLAPCYIGSISTDYFILKVPSSIYSDYGDIERVEDLYSHVAIANGVIV